MSPRAWLVLTVICVIDFWLLAYVVWIWGAR